MPDRDGSIILPLLFTLLIPFAWVGLSLANTGLNRTRSAAHSVLSSMCAAAVAILVFGGVGIAIAGYAGQPAHVLHLGGKTWGWAGGGSLFTMGVKAIDAHGAVVLLFQFFAVALAAQIAVAAGAERWHMMATFASTAFFAGIVFPFLIYWTWGAGWLSQLGTSLGLGQGFVDVGGAFAIQAAGGFQALSIGWLLGARQGKFTPEGIPTAMPGHNAVFVVVGSLFALLGWIGLIAGGAVLFFNASAETAVFAVLNTLLAACGGALAAFATTRIRFGKPDTSLTANGWIAGLVAVSAGGPFFKLPEAILVGIVAGVAVIFAIELIEIRMHVDDPAGAIAVHAVSGVWGMLAVGMFAQLPSVGPGAGSDSGQFLAQLVGVGTVLGFALPACHMANLVINRFYKHRVEPAGERQGMDLHELGAGAYPEFVTHREDFSRR